MIAHYLTPDGNEAYKVGPNHDKTRVLVQLQDENGEQVRLALPLNVASDMVALIDDALDECFRVRER